MAHQFTEEQVRATVHALDAAGVEVIEVTHGDGLGGSSFNYGFSRVDEIKLIAAGVQEATQAKIAVLLVPGIGTKDNLRDAREAGASVARIATHCTEADVSIQHFGLARDLGMETVGFLMMAHKTTPGRAGQAGPDHGGRRRAVRLLRGLGRRAGARRRAGAGPGHVRGDRPPGRDRLPRPPEPLPRRGQLGAGLPARRPPDRRRAVRARRRGGQLAHRGAGGHLRPPRRAHRAWTWAGCWPRPRRWSGRSCRAGRRWTGRRSCRAGPGCTAASCCTPSGPPSATACPPTRSCSGPASSATSAARRT